MSTISPLKKKKLERSETFVPKQKNTSKKIQSEVLKTTKLRETSLEDIRVLSSVLGKKQYEIIDEAVSLYISVQSDELKKLIYLTKKL